MYLLVGSYTILRHINNVEYKLDLPTDLILVHLVFHVSMLKKSISVPALMVSIESVGLKDSLLQTCPIEISDHRVHNLRNKEAS